MSQSVEQFLLCMRMHTQLCWFSILPILSYLEMILLVTQNMMD